MDIEKFIGLSLVSTALVVMLRQHRPEIAVLLSAAAAGIMLLWILKDISPLMLSLKAAADRAGLSNNHVQTLIKSAGICFAVQTAIDACRDAGETALAGKIELAGKIAVLYICLPVMHTLIQTILELILF